MKLLLRLVVAFGALFATELFAGNLTVNLAPTGAINAGARWRVDGAGWQTSGATVSNLTDTTHTVEYKSASGWITPAAHSVTITAGATTKVTTTYAQASSMRITLTPTNGLWRVDGGSWQGSGGLVVNLAFGNHTVEYGAVTGYSAPPTEVVTLSSTTTLALTRSYTQLAQLTVTLTPSNAQWRVDGGTWRNSGATVSNLSVGNHTIDYNTLAGYATPPNETVALVAGANPLARSYTQPAQVTVTLTPSNAQWRIDGGAWRNSGTTATGLSAGNHSLEYSNLNGYTSPATETITLTSGQSLPLARSYTQLAQLAVTLNPSAAQWRVDGGSWQNSGATVANLSVGSHTVDYAPLSGYAAPASESVTLTSGQALSLSRSYVQLASLTVTLTPSAGQWRVDGGSWQASGATVANLSVGSHNLEYSALSGYSAPANESVTLTAGQNLTVARSYAPLFAQVSITLTPANAQWQIDGGTWQPSGTVVDNLSAGSHTINYAPLNGYNAPASESITLSAGQNASLNRSYTQLASLTITLTPATAQWSLNGGTWYSSGATADDLSPGMHTIQYAYVSGYLTPTSESVTLVGGANSLSRTYAESATVSVTLTPATAQWRVLSPAGNSPWLPSGQVVPNAPLGAASIEFSDAVGYVTPAPLPITLVSGTNNFSQTYAEAASIIITLSPSTAQWRAISSAGTSPWFPSGYLAQNGPLGLATIEFSDVDGYITPAPLSVNMVSGLNPPLQISYAQPASLSVTLTPVTAEWRLQGEPTWRISGTAATGLTPGAYTIEYASVAGYLTPATESITLAEGPTTLSRAYTETTSLTVNLTPATAQWRLQGETTWRNSGTTAANLTPGSATIEYNSVWTYMLQPAEPITLVTGSNLFSKAYTPMAAVTINSNVSTRWRFKGDSDWFSSGFTRYFPSFGLKTIEFENVTGYVTPAAIQVTFVPGPVSTPPITYTPLATLAITLNPTGTWRVDNGPWFGSGVTMSNLLPGSHTIEYNNLYGHIAPEIETINLVPGANNFSRTYTPKAALTLVLNPSAARWRLDGGPWFGNRVTLSNLLPGVHTIEYDNVSNYITPEVETIILTGGPNNLTREYTPKASLTLSLNPSASWRLDGGPWFGSGVTMTNLLPGEHSIEYMNVPGYITPPIETVSLATGPNSLTRNYTAKSSLTLTLYPAVTRWRVDGGPWVDSGTTMSNLSSGQHTVEYAPLWGYLIPATEQVTLNSGPNSLVRNVPARTSFTIVTSPIDAKWRLDGGQWRNSYEYIWDLPAGSHLIEYADLEGYLAPASESITTVAGTNPPLTRNFASAPGFVSNPNLASLRVYTGAAIQWRLDGGAWTVAGATRHNLALGSHTLEFLLVDGTIPAPESINLAAGTNPVIIRNFSTDAYLQVRLTPADGSFRIDGGEWYPNPRDVALPPGPHIIDYRSVYGYVTPSSETVNLVTGSYTSVIRTYSSVGGAASLYFSSSTEGARVRLNGGEWLSATNGPPFNLPAGSYTAEYSPVFNYLTPPTETVTLVSGTNNLNRNYAPVPTVVLYSNTPGARFRVDGGEWLHPNVSSSPLPPGTHTIEYSPTYGYLTPPPESITLSGGLNTISRNYTPAAIVSLSFNTTSARYRVDGGSWISGSTSSPPLMPGVYSLEYSPVAGYLTPPTETVTLVSGTNNITRSYVDLSAFTIGAPGGSIANNPATFTTWSPDGTGFGVNELGGTYGGGYLFRYSYIGGPTVMREFGGLPHDGLVPSELIFASDNQLYGTTATGSGDAVDGTIFTIRPDGSNYTPLHFFLAATDGSLPVDVIEGDDGLLYGTTARGGSAGRGVVFRIAKDGTGFTVLLSIGASTANTVIPGSGLWLYGGNFLIPVFPRTPDPIPTP